MASEGAIHSPPTTPFKYSNRVLLKTLLERSDGGSELIGQRIVIGGWVRSSKEVKKSSAAPPQSADDKVDDTKHQDVTCVEILQSRIPFIRSILEAFGGSGYAPRKRLESGAPKHTPPQPSTVYLLVTDGSGVEGLQVNTVVLF